MLKMKTGSFVWLALIGCCLISYLEALALQGTDEAEIQLEKEMVNTKKKSMAAEEKQDSTVDEEEPSAVEEKKSMVEEENLESQREKSMSIAIQDKTSGGLTYIRWGHDGCPKGVELIYSGIMAGSYYRSNSGGSNFQCLTQKPQYVLRYHGGVQNSARLYGTEYYHSMVGKSSHNVPCALCYAPTRTAKFMLPGGASCPKGWTREYLGYLMSPRFWYYGEYGTYECVDRAQKSVPGSKGCKYGTFLSYVEAHCDGAPCPPFDPQKELNCVVCTK